MTTSNHGPRFSPDDLRQVWVPAPADDLEAIARVTSTHGVDFATAAGRVWEADDFVYLPVIVLLRESGQLRREAVIFALSDDLLVTYQPRRHFPPFDKAVARMRRTPELSRTPHGVMHALLYALNEASERVIDRASDDLESMAEVIERAAQGVDSLGRDIGVTDMRATIASLNDAEQVVSRCQETQLSLARAARYLRTEIPVDEARLGQLVEVLVADIEGVKQHASFEHDKVRYLQQSIMTSLDVKQNQIVKVFTIITAVFLPPTLIATFYGMNFTVFPELNWKHGFPAAIGMTLVAALLPLLYIKRRGWLR